jgi:ribosomal protein S4E
VKLRASMPVKWAVVWVSKKSKYLNRPQRGRENKRAAVPIAIGLRLSYSLLLRSLL